MTEEEDNPCLQGGILKVSGFRGVAGAGEGAGEGITLMASSEYDLRGGARDEIVEGDSADSFCLYGVGADGSVMDEGARRTTCRLNVCASMT